MQNDIYAIRVVSLLRQTMNKYYASVDEKDGRYEAARINQDVIFFSPTFRDDHIQAKENRETAWGHRIRDFKTQCIGRKW